MNQNNPNNIDISETDTTTEASRRSFLTGSAAAVVGATAATITSSPASADHLTNGGVHEPDGVTEVPNPGHSGNALAAMMVKAWKTPGFKGQLLAANHAAAKAILQQENVPNPPDKPKFIDPVQYKAGYQREVDEVVYLIPDEPNVGGSPVSPNAVARVLMAAVPFGM
jgi:hypothetical protein